MCLPPCSTCMPELCVCQHVASAHWCACSSRLATGAVAGLFLGDEIVCGGVPVRNLSAVADFCKQQLTAAGHADSLVPAHSS